MSRQYSQPVSAAARISARNFRLGAVLGALGGQLDRAPAEEHPRMVRGDADRLAHMAEPLA